MIGLRHLGTNDCRARQRLYDALLAEIGAKRLDVRTRYRWGVAPDKPGLRVMKPTTTGKAGHRRQRRDGRDHRRRAR